MVSTISPARNYRPNILLGTQRFYPDEIPMALELTSYPRELDDHVRLYGMRADEFKYSGEDCPICNNRIDSLALCGHGNIGGD